MMPGRPIPSLLEDIAALLEIKDENPFKVRAYYNAAKVLSAVDNLDELIAGRRLKEVKGIGDALAAKIQEYAETGRMAYYEELTREIPESLLEMLQIPNLGPKKIKVLYETLAITNVGELEYACKENRLVNLHGFGAKTQEKILKGIEFVKKHKGEFLFGDVYPLAMRIKEGFEGLVAPGFAEVCGSIRRRKEVVHDLDILVAGDDPAALSRHFASMPDVEEIIAEGDTKTSCRLSSGIEADLRVVGAESWACALVYFTGSKEHNVKLRGIAKRKGYKLNEYGLFPVDEERPVPLATEEEVYNFFGLAYIPPELREDMGEIEAAQAGTLPNLVTLQDIRGTFHVHTERSDGVDPLPRIVEGAKRLGYSYVGITDHSKSAYYAGGLKREDVLGQWEEIDRLNAADDGFRIFKGIESDILPDGSLDYDDELLEGFDFIIVSVHSSFGMKREDMERRLIRAMAQPLPIVLGHPTGRLLLSRDGYDIDMHTIIDAAAEYHAIIELNASPYRLDIDWRYLRYAKEKGVLISINPDAHAVAGLSEVSYGVGIARKGWQEKDDILNTRDVAEVSEIFRRLRREKQERRIVA
jgi:DNA polymerase (family 10)